jgi:hypothetical protein
MCCLKPKRCRRLSGELCGSLRAAVGEVAKPRLVPTAIDAATARSRVLSG